MASGEATKSNLYKKTIIVYNFDYYWRKPYDPVVFFIHNLLYYKDSQGYWGMDTHFIFSFLNPSHSKPRTQYRT